MHGHGHKKVVGKIASLGECFDDPQVFLLLAICLADAADGAILGSTFKSLETEMGLTPSGLAMMALFQSICMKVASPIWGYLCDENIASRKVLMMTGCIGWGVAMIMLGLATSLWQLYALRSLNGIFLACLGPLGQSWVADIAKPQAFGAIFGLMGVASHLGGTFSGGLTTSLTSKVFFGISGWRIMCFAVGLLSWGLGLLISSIMTSKQSTSSDRSSGVYSITKIVTNLIACLRIPTFCMIIAQGIVGCVPWVAMQFEVMYLQYISFSNEQVGFYLLISGLFGIAGPLIGGLLGDALHRWSENHGRPIVGQLSVLLGLPFYLVLLKVLPDTIGASALWPYIVCRACFNLVAVWTPAGVNRPVMCAIVPKSRRASILAWELSIEGGISSAFTLPMVAYLTEQVFGYQTTTLAVSAMPESQRLANMHALQSTLICLGIIPWLLCFVFYSLMHIYYPQDRAMMAQELAEEEDEQAALM